MMCVRASSVYALRTLHAISTKYASTPQSGVALRTILAAAELLRAKACIVISPESESITPEWISNLVRPVYYDGFDLVSPTYRRHKFDGLLMTNLLYPMVRALYGVRIREAYMSGVRILRSSRKPIPWPESMERWNRRRRDRTPLDPGCGHRRIPHLPVLSRKEGSRRTARR